MSSLPPSDPIFQVIDLLGDSWSWMILHEALFTGVTRFTDFQQRLGVAPKVLTKRLVKLTAGGLLERQSARQDGGHPQYRLTPMGRDFLPCLIVAVDWGQRWGEEEATPHAIHRDHVLRPILQCSECAMPLAAQDVVIATIYRASADLIGTRRQRMPDLDGAKHSDLYAIAHTLRVFGDRWSSLIIRECFLGTRRFGMFQEHLGIAPNILTSRLERLVSLGMLKRMPLPGPTSWTEYRLTQRGFDLYPVPLSLLTWAEKWLLLDGPRTELRHKRCGKRFMSVLACGTCGDSVEEKDIHVERRDEAAETFAPGRMAH